MIIGRRFLKPSMPSYRTLSLCVLIVLILGVCVPAYGADSKPVQMDIAKAVSQPVQYMGKQVSFVGAATIGNEADANQIIMYGVNAGKPVIVLVKFKNGSGIKAEAGETFFIVGTFSNTSTPSKLVLEESVGFSACRIVGQARDGKDPLPGVVFFTYPFGTAVEALDKGKDALISLVRDGKMAGIGNAGGFFDVIVASGSADLLALYTDPSHMRKSALWVFSSDMPNGAIRMDLDMADAYMRW